jgi:FkbM family methyltransferase
MKIISYLITFPILKRLLSSVIRRILIILKKENFQIKFKNLLLETNIKDPHDREIFFNQRYEEKQFKESFYNIEKYKIEIFLDIGANSGIYSMLVAKKFGNLTIEAFEPIKTTYEKLTNNIQNNYLQKKIITHNFGLSNKNSILKMKTNIKFGYKQSAGYFVSKNGDEQADFILGDKLLRYKNKNIFIKIDTEGHEFFVIEGMNKLILNNNIILQIEIWKNNYTSTNILLEKHGFTYFKKINDDYYYSKFDSQ